MRLQCHHVVSDEAHPGDGRSALPQLVVGQELGARQGADEDHHEAASGGSQHQDGGLAAKLTEKDGRDGLGEGLVGLDGDGDRTRDLQPHVACVVDRVGDVVPRTLALVNRS